MNKNSLWKLVFIVGTLLFSYVLHIEIPIFGSM